MSASSRHINYIGLFRFLRHYGYSSYRSLSLFFELAMVVNHMYLLLKTPLFTAVKRFGDTIFERAIVHFPRTIVDRSTFCSIRKHLGAFLPPSTTDAHKWQQSMKVKLLRCYVAR